MEQFEETVTIKLSHYKVLAQTFDSFEKVINDTENVHVVGRVWNGGYYVLNTDSATEKLIDYIKANEAEIAKLKDEARRLEGKWYVRLFKWMGV